MGDNSDKEDMRMSSDMSAVYRIEAQNNLMLSQIAGVMDSQRNINSKMGQVSESVARLEQNVGHMSTRQDRTDKEISEIKSDVTDLKMKIVRYTTAAGIAAVIIGWVGNAYVTQTVKDTISKPSVSLASPSGK